MYNLQLTNSLGRTGNCMLCIIGAIDFSIKNNINKITFPSMSWQCPILPGNKDALINKMEITIDDEDIDESVRHYSVSDVNKKVSWKSKENKFEAWFVSFYLPMSTFERRIEIARKYIRPLFILNEKKLDSNDLVIHLRSGDIFARAHYAYIQPPYEFYKDIINSRKWNNIYIITEKPNNPCYDKLKLDYPNIITFLEHGNRAGGNGWGFKDDLEYLLGCAHYIPCQSSLCSIIIQMSETIKHVYLPSYMLKLDGHHAIREHKIWWSDLAGKKESFILSDIEFNIYNYDEYINTPDKIFQYNQQKNIDYLLNYKNK